MKQERQKQRKRATGALRERGRSCNKRVVIDCIVSEAAQGPVCRGLQSICGQYRQSQLTAPSNKPPADSYQPSASSRSLYVCRTTPTTVG